jgi:antitoxin CptB
MEPEPGERGCDGRNRQASLPGYRSWTVMTDDVESRRRRAVFRATHRGSKEMDWLIGRFADARIAQMAPATLAHFERLLQMPDPELHDMIFHPDLAPAGEFTELIGELRTFHGLK